jgi:hypothetical protein
MYAERDYMRRWKRPLAHTNFRGKIIACSVFCNSCSSNFTKVLPEPDDPNVVCVHYSDPAFVCDFNSL